MEIYTVKGIYEADFGCEETGRKTPMALVKLVSCPEDAEEKNIEVSEADLEKYGITEGKKVYITGSGKILRYVRVVAAVICGKDNEKNTFFATARGYGEYKGWWEFPGGKIEPGETPQQAIVREIREELTAEIEVGERIMTVEYDYPTFHLSMDCFWAEIKAGQLVLKEAMDARWLSREAFDEVKWLPADWMIIEEIRKSL